MSLADLAVQATRRVSTLIVLMGLTACSTSEPIPPQDQGHLFGPDPVGAAISGAPDEGTTRIAEALVAHLSSDEIAYLQRMRLDIEAGVFLSDPVVRKAIAVVPEALRDRSTSVSSALLGTKSSSDSHCITLKNAMTERLAHALKRIIVGAGAAAVGCYGVVPSVGTSMPLCVAGVIAVALGVADLEFGAVAGAIEGAVNDALGCAEAAECIHDRKAFAEVCMARGATFDGCSMCNASTDGGSETVPPDEGMSDAKTDSGPDGSMGLVDATPADTTLSADASGDETTDATVSADALTTDSSTASDDGDVGVGWGDADETGISDDPLGICPAGQSYCGWACAAGSKKGAFAGNCYDPTVSHCCHSSTPWAGDGSVMERVADVCGSSSTCVAPSDWVSVGSHCSPAVFYGGAGIFPDDFCPP